MADEPDLDVEAVASHIAALRANGGANRKRFLESVGRMYAATHRHRVEAYSPPLLYLDNGDLNLAALGMPLRRTLFEIEDLLFGAFGDDLRIWMIYLSRHKIDEVFDSGLLSPSENRPWEGFDDLVRSGYDDKAGSRVDFNLGQLRSWRCFSTFFVDADASFALVLDGPEEATWKIARGNDLIARQFLNDTRKETNWETQEQLYDAVRAFARIAWKNYQDQDCAVATKRALYIVGVGSHDRGWPNKILRAGEAGDDLNSIFLIFSLDHSETPAATTLVRVSGLLGAIDGCLKKALSSELHEIVRSDAKRLEELTRVLAGKQQDGATRASLPNRRISLESLLVEVAPTIKSCVKLVVVRMNSLRDVLWTSSAQLSGQRSISIFRKDLTEYANADDDGKIWVDEHFEFVFYDNESVSVVSPISHASHQKIQLIRIIHVLMLRLKTRRAALRTAVSAIMGRNMSHNIGSHVIARYSSKAANDVEKPGSDEADHRGDFLAYVQRRMDFLAEIATSDQAFWSQPLSLEVQVGRLNYATQMKRFRHELRKEDAKCPVDPNCGHLLSPRKKSFADNKVPAFSKRPILLSFITGKESLLASVEYGLPDNNCEPGHQAPPDCCLGHKSKQQGECWFACPGGEVGAHALFVILENVIRNSARHGGSGNDTVRIFVHVPDKCAEPTDFLVVELIDPRTKLYEDGREIRGNEPNESKRKEMAAEEAEELRQHGTKSLFDSEGKRRKLTSLVCNINSILNDEPFLDASGTPNSKYWGVREMQICAHYLRGYSLADLEGAQPNPPVLEAVVHDLRSDSHCLKYRLYLQRPRLLAAVVHDSSSWKKHTDTLRKKGVVVLQLSDGWRQIAKAARDYSVLAVDADIDIPKDEDQRTCLPVRGLKLKTDPIKNLIQNLIQRTDEDLDWMEPLHKQWAEQLQNLRDLWRDKPMYGLVVGQDVLGKPSRSGLPLAPSNEGGLFWVEKNTASQIAPLPFVPEIVAWHKRLNSEVIAAAWVDHAGQTDFHRTSYARLGQAAVRPPQNAGLTNDKERTWISAEGAFSDSPHTTFLSTCLSGGGWELLAASVPRVAVLDERVQSERARDARSGLLLGDMWPLMGVWVPKKFPEPNTDDHCGDTQVCDLDTPNFKSIRAFLCAPAKRKDQHPIDFLVIHLTILERLSKEIGKKLPETLNLLKGETQAKQAVIIIVTGRGVPSMARKISDDQIDTVRYLPISALLETLISRPSKLALMRALWSAGKPDE